MELSLIQNNERFKECGGVLLAELIGGSKLYGLDTPESDTDFRGIFAHTNPYYLSGFENIESIVQNGKIDSCHYEVMRYLQLLRKSNTQVLEIVFAPKESFTAVTPGFKMIQDNRFALIDTDKLKTSLKGYVFSEMKLATGERSGQLGGKRKNAVQTYGFSPKNFVQIIRLCAVGKRFFQTGEYMVKVKDFDETLYDFLMDVKTNSSNYNRDQLKTIVNRQFEELCSVMDESKIEFKFNLDIASEIIMKIRRTHRIVTDCREFKHEKTSK